MTKASSALMSEISKNLLELVHVRNIWWPEDFQENQYGLRVTKTFTKISPEWATGLK